jgi:protein NrfD
LVLFLFLSHLAIGIIFTLVFVPREAGVKFFRFNAGLAALLMVAAFTFRPPEASATEAGKIAFGAVVVFEAAVVLYWITIGRVLAKVRPLVIAISILAGIVALLAQAVASSDPAVPLRLITILSFFSSALLLGGACTAMILGHWYLVIPSMQVEYLQSIVKFHMASMVFRVVVVGTAIFVGIVTWEPGLGPSFHHYIFSIAGIFFWQRMLFGLLGPAVLSYLTWETAKIRSTQSATGILYVDFFTVVVGEVLAKYLLLATHVAV